MYHKYTKELLEPIVKESISKSEVLRKLGLKQTGGNNKNLTKNIEKFNIDTSHFLGRGYRKNKQACNRRSTSDYLSNEYQINSNRLKKRLIDEGYFEPKCHQCNRKTWMKQPIPLDLHHIDHDHDNNSLDNLVILCPNCHRMQH